MASFDDVLQHYQRQVGLSWQADVPHEGRVWILWYDKTLDRRVRGRLHELEAATGNAGHGWRHVDLGLLFPTWIVCHELFGDLLAAPEELRGLLPEFKTAVVDELRSALSGCGANDLLVLSGCGAMFGLVRISALIGEIASQIPGRLLLLFPGQHRAGVYKLLDAREGWNYHAVPIPASDAY